MQLNSNNMKKRKDLEFEETERLHFVINAFAPAKGLHAGEIYDFEFHAYDATGERFRFYVETTQQMNELRKIFVEALGMLDGLRMRYGDMRELAGGFPEVGDE